MSIQVARHKESPNTECIPWGLSLSLLDSEHRFPVMGNRRTASLHHRGECRIRGAGFLQRRRGGSPVSQSCWNSKSVSLQRFPKAGSQIYLHKARVSLGEATTTSTCSLVRARAAIRSGLHWPGKQPDSRRPLVGPEQAACVEVDSAPCITPWAWHRVRG
ncbi:hypothetical protein CI102_12663 [Trichoderma harzianum]|nr:hypothetical protein CI102_12663 [Trichoderma harzianum]